MIAGMLLVSVLTALATLVQVSPEKSSRQTSILELIDQENDAALCPKTKQDSRIKPASAFFGVAINCNHTEAVSPIVLVTGRWAMVAIDFLQQKLLQRLFPFHSFP